MGKFEDFVFLAKIFNDNDHELLLVGGTVRDTIFKLPLSDMDLVTDATPAQMKVFLCQENLDDTFEKFGFIKYKFNDNSFDITTFRKESNYLDSRHPQEIVFVKSPKDDYLRRDFTINAMYMDKDRHLIDYVDGLSDINNKILRMVGDPLVRIKEDPLRILRAIRFKNKFGLTYDLELEKAIFTLKNLLTELNPDKIKQEIRKMKDVDQDLLISDFKKFGISYLIDMIK